VKSETDQDKRWLLVGDLPCLGCEYNLRGLVGPMVACPECGHHNDLRNSTAWRLRKLPLGEQERQHWPAYSVLISLLMVMGFLMTAHGRGWVPATVTTLVLFACWAIICVRWVRSCKRNMWAITILLLVHGSSWSLIISLIFLPRFRQISQFSFTMAVIGLVLGIAGIIITSKLIKRGEIKAQFRHDWKQWHVPTSDPGVNISPTGVASMSDNKTAIVTGAGSGIGCETAKLLSAQGYNVVLVGRTRSKLEKTAQVCESAAVVVLDIVKPLAAGRVVALTLERFGRVDAVAHVAGFAPNIAIDQLTPEVVSQCMETNLGAAARLATAAWKALKVNAGVIVNVSSMASIDPFPGFSIYAAAKIGVNMFTRCIAQEGEAAGITAVTIAPGAVETPMLRELFDETVIPRDKAMDPKNVAQVIVDCVTGERAFESGEVITVPSP